MLFKTTTAEKVEKLLNEKSAREEKIQESMRNIDNQVEEIEKSVRDLMDRYISLELEGKSSEVEKIDKVIDEKRLQLESLKGKKDAYSRVVDDDNRIKDAIPGILETARKDKDERLKLLNKKRTERQSFAEKIDDMKKQLTNLEYEINQLEAEKEAINIIPLLKYIEPRKINSEKSYASTLINGAMEYLDQYVEKDNAWFGPRVTVQVDESKITDSLIRTARGY